MEYEKGLAAVASITTLTSDVHLLGTLYSRNAVYRVNAKTALAAEKSEKFKVVWDKGAKPKKGKQPKNELPKAETPAAPEPEQKADAGEDEEKKTDEEDEEEGEEMTPEQALAEFDKVKTADAYDFLVENWDDPEILAHFAKNAKYKTSKKAAKKRLAEVKGE